MAGWLDFDRQRWQAHYGEQWPRMVQSKQEFDPNYILNPAGIPPQPIVAGLCLVVLALTAFFVFGRVESSVSLEAAQVLPGERHDLVAPASGTVEDVLVEVSDTVAPGQPVAYIRPPDAHHWEPVIVGILNALEKAGRLEEETIVELLQALLVAGPAASSTAQLEATSPYGGEVVAMNLAPGQAVRAGDSVGLVRAASTDLPEVVTFISPSDASGLSAGMEARVSFGVPGNGGRQVFQGQVEEVSARPDTASQMVKESGSRYT